MANRQRRECGLCGGRKVIRRMSAVGTTTARLVGKGKKPYEVTEQCPACNGRGYHEGKPDDHA
jgi:hypothetical protein